MKSGNEGRVCQNIGGITSAYHGTSGSSDGRKVVSFKTVWLFLVVKDGWM